MNTIIIEDSKTIAQILNTTMQSYGYITEIIPSSIIREKYLKSIKKDLVIMNTNLTYKDSISILKSIKKHGIEAYTLGITSKGSWQDKVNFLKNGGDDVISFPFAMQELLARIQSLLRRPKQKTGDKISLEGMKVEIDPVHRKVYKSNLEVKLRRKEFQLLEYMARNKNRTLTRNELMDHVWDYRKITASNTVDVHVKRLREKLDNPFIIRTMYGYGYKLSDKQDKDIKPKVTIESDEIPPALE